MLKWIRDKIPIWRAEMEDGGGDRRVPRGYPLRMNLIIVAALIAILNAGIMGLTYIAISQARDGNDNQFIIGALIGLLPTGITGLVGLGTTLLNEGRQ